MVLSIDITNQTTEHMIEYFLINVYSYPEDIKEINEVINWITDKFNLYHSLLACAKGRGYYRCIGSGVKISLTSIEQLMEFKLRWM